MEATTTTESVPVPEAVINHDAETERKEPPPEKPADVRRRSLVILAFWAIVLCLGLPIWWKTTTIYRASLPVDEMLDWSDGRVCTISNTTTHLSTVADLILLRPAVQSSLSRSPSRRTSYSTKRHRTSYGLPSTSTTSRATTCVYS
jgi:hypothetical protein